MDSPGLKKLLDDLRYAYDTAEAVRRLWAWARKQPDYRASRLDGTSLDVDFNRLFVHAKYDVEAAAAAVAQATPPLTVADLMNAPQE